MLAANPGQQILSVPVLERYYVLWSHESQQESGSFNFQAIFKAIPDRNLCGNLHVWLVVLWNYQDGMNQFYSLYVHT